MEIFFQSNYYNDISSDKTLINNPGFFQHFKMLFLLMDIALVFIMQTTAALGTNFLIKVRSG